MRISSKAPTRVDLAGGTLDIWPLYLFHPGAVTVNAAITRYASCVIDQHDEGDTRIKLVSRDTKREESFDSFAALVKGKSYRLPLLAEISKFFQPEAASHSPPIPRLQRVRVSAVPVQWPWRFVQRLIDLPGQGRARPIGSTSAATPKPSSYASPRVRRITIRLHLAVRPRSSCRQAANAEPSCASIFPKLREATGVVLHRQAPQIRDQQLGTSSRSTSTAIRRCITTWREFPQWPSHCAARWKNRIGPKPAA